MPEMEPQDPAPEPKPQMESQVPAPEPQPPMGTILQIVRFGGPIYSRRGQKRTIAETVSESDDIHQAPSPIRPRTDPESDDIHQASSPLPSLLRPDPALPSPLRPDPGSYSSQTFYELIERCRIKDKKTVLGFLEDLLKELKRAGLSRFMKEEPTYRRNADCIYSLLERLRFEEASDLKKNLEDILSLYSEYTKISFSCERMEANIDDLTSLREVLERESNFLEVTQKSHDEDRHTVTTILNSLEKTES